MNIQHIFVSEYLSCGALADEPLDSDLLAEGQLMWRTLLEDLLALPDLTITTTIDGRLKNNNPFPPLVDPRLTVHTVTNSADERQLFERLACASDGVLLIAPELDHILEHRISILERLKKNALMSESAAVTLTADKWQFSKFCQRHGICTPNTELLSSRLTLPVRLPFAFPCIIKPVLGAGGTATFRVRAQTQWDQLRAEDTALIMPAIVQPLLPGIAASLSCIVGPITGQVAWLPIGQQQFDDHHNYYGGTIPFHTAHAAQARNIARQLVDLLPGLRGYIGFDFLIDEHGQYPVQLLEINPRLTTSFVGYRQLSRDSLSAWMLGRSHANSISFSQDTIHFQC